MSLTSCEVGQSKTSFIFSSSILIPSGPITTPKNPTFLVFYLHFSGFTYKLLSASCLTTSSTISSCPSYISISIITLLIKLTIFPVLIRPLRISFIMVYNVASELVSPKNITISSNDSSGMVNIAFHLFPSFICTLLYFYLKSTFVNTFFVSIFSIISKIKGKG